MLSENLKLLAMLYYRPVAAANRLLDHGNMAFALIAAVITAILLHLPVVSEPGGFMRYMAGQAPAALYGVENLETAAESAPALPSTTVPTGKSPLRWAAERFVGYDPQSLVGNLASLALVFVPVSILILARWEMLGGGATILRRDYMPALMCVMICWTAAYLPLALANSISSTALKTQLPVWLWYAASSYFAVLACICLRTVLGSTFFHAAGAVAGAWIVSIGGVLFYRFSGPFFFYLASPCYLFYGYRLCQADLSLIATGLRSRQSFRRYLEASTINPRDADAHYQLGLIYQQRRNYTEAISRFAKAVEIDGSEADAHYQLGRLAREQGRFEDSLQHLMKAASIDDKHASSEVWRDIGAVRLQLSHQKEASQALTKYVERRPYDPEGLYWYGVALSRQGNAAEARSALERAVEAAETSPSHRRAHLRKWSTQARSELRALAKG